MNGPLSVKVVNSWKNNDLYASQYDGVISNDSDEILKNWSIEIAVPEDATIENSWNGNFELSKGKLTITPMDYNKEVTKEADVTFGFILDTKKDVTIGEYTLFVDGKKYTSVENKHDKKEEASTESSKEDTKDEAKKQNETKQQSTKKEEGTPVANHGALSVVGTQIMDEHNKPYELRGVSTHGIAWFPQYVSKEAFQTLRDDWNANVVRIAMYTAENGGYCEGGSKKELESLVETGVDAATELGMYVIIDWHILHDSDPQVNKDAAKEFFATMSEQYADHNNVLYEICNEPNNTLGYQATWNDHIKPYAEEIIPIIRKNDKDAIILVGTPTWSQDVDEVVANPIQNESNIMYTVHFYAATHTDSIRSKVTTALDNGIPVFISEFSICDASGNGGIDYNQAEQWMTLLKDNKISFVGWSLSNKAETSALIKSSCQKTSGWEDDDLSEAGSWLKETIKK